jgi:4'-phosphopantetheinyl transferase
MVLKQTLNDLKSGYIHIWRIDLDGPVDDLTALLSTEEISRANAKLSTKERDRSIRVRGAVRSILGDYLGVAGGEIEFVAGEKGKPSIYRPDSNIEFNLTHCEEIAFLAVAYSTPVGIDLERIRHRPSQLKIAQRMFSESICRELAQLSSGQLDAAFSKHWTELEARAKCVGSGIFSYQKGMNEITTSHFTPQDGWIACLAVKSTDITSMNLQYFVYRK